jgi:lipopolysaccharide heptosyltransferase I
VRIEASKIGIVRLGSIGDVINTLPLLNRLRAGYPASHIAWVVEAKAAAILDGHPALDSLILFPRNRPRLWPGFVRRLRRAGFDLLLDCQRIIRSGLVTWISGAPHRVGFDRARCKEGSWIFTNHHIPPNDRPGVTLERYLEFADYLQLPPTPVSWNIALDTTDRQKALRIIGDNGSPPVVVNVGASTPEKRWPAGHFSALIAVLKNHWKGPLVLTGGAEDRERAATIAQGTHVQDMSGALSLKELAALLEAAAVVVSSDTGPLHLAVAMGAPVIGLYGPSDPARTGPFGQPEGVIVGQGGPKCRACRRWCGDPYTPCMRDISPKIVFQKMEKRLARHPSWIT